MQEVLSAAKTKDETEIEATTALKPSFEDLTEAYGDALWRFCRAITHSKEEAEDLFQDTLLKAMEQQTKLYESKNCKGFLFSTANFLWKSKKRIYARRVRLAPVERLNEDIISDTNIEGGILAKEDMRLLREIVYALPEKLKIPTILFYTAEASIADIAAALKLAPRHSKKPSA